MVGISSLGQFFALALILTGSQADGQSPIFQTDSYSGLSNDSPNEPMTSGAKNT
jgi:hypothetical protein